MTLKHNFGGADFKFGENTVEVHADARWEVRPGPPQRSSRALKGPRTNEGEEEWIKGVKREKFHLTDNAEVLDASEMCISRYIIEIS